MKQSVIRNLLDSSNKFYINEIKKTQREHSRELLKQIEANKERKKRERKQQIEYDRRLERKIKKGKYN
jgi:uncharacterized protein YaiL (DUF2058 family)